MSIRVKIPGIWRGLTAGESGPLIEGDSVGVVLQRLTAAYPDLRARLFGGDGELKPYLHVFLNQVDIRTLEGVETPTEDGDEILLLMAVAGG